MDPFDLFEIPPTFDIDEEDLHCRFLQATAENHPDRYDDPVQQADAADRSALINEAYVVLKDPERRANALIARLGGPAKEDDKSLPPDLLMEMMEIRERLEDAQASGDAEKQRELAAWAAGERRRHLDAIASLFDTTRNGPPDQLQPTLKRVRVQLNALRYVQRMIDQTTG